MHGAEQESCNVSIFTSSSCWWTTVMLGDMEERSRTSRRNADWKINFMLSKIVFIWVSLVIKTIK